MMSYITHFYPRVLGTRDRNWGQRPNRLVALIIDSKVLFVINNHPKTQSQNHRIRFHLASLAEAMALCWEPLGGSAQGLSLILYFLGSPCELVNRKSASGSQLYLEMQRIPHPSQPHKHPTHPSSLGMTSHLAIQQAIGSQDFTENMFSHMSIHS